MIVTSQPVIAIFDIGKTNKKLFLFDEEYNIVFEKSGKFEEITDEDGDACDDLKKLEEFVLNSVKEVLSNPSYDLKCVNFATYGASFVYINKEGNALTPLYNYLKEYPKDLSRQFYNNYGDSDQMALETASPTLGSLNSGMQVYRIKHQKPDVFQKVKYAMHLPQYLSFLLTGIPTTDISSIGCHTQLWDFGKNEYHNWVTEENLDSIFPKITPSESVISTQIEGKEIKIGIGLHDSSSALIPYLKSFQEPFALISTGTWSITLNPFNDQILTKEELDHDSLCYMSYKGIAVKASRIFLGNEHEVETKRLAAHFKVKEDEYKDIKLDKALISNLKNKRSASHKSSEKELKNSVFASRNLNDFSSYSEAYHQLNRDLVEAQIQSSKLVLENSPVKNIYVDGGFGKNEIFMNLLSEELPNHKVFAASVAQATAIGSALALHSEWNSKSLSEGFVELREV